MAFRTDLACEARKIWENSAQSTTKLTGVRAEDRVFQGLDGELVEILNEEGARALGKPVGTYLSLELSRDRQQGATALAEGLETLLGPSGEGNVLVVGLGNRAMTPDALGPLAAQGIFVTRHLTVHMPQLGLRPVCALTPGVLGTTGVESLEVVRSVVDRVRPERVIVVDALAAGERRRLCTTVQLTDTGIVPGSGVGNARAGFSRESLGVPVCAVGVPTVMDTREDGAVMTVTPRDIDAQVRRLSRIISSGINRYLFPDWEDSTIAEFVENG